MKKTIHPLIHSFNIYIIVTHTNTTDQRRPILVNKQTSKQANTITNAKLVLLLLIATDCQQTMAAAATPATTTSSHLPTTLLLAVLLLLSKSVFGADEGNDNRQDPTTVGRLRNDHGSDDIVAGDVGVGRGGGGGTLGRIRRLHQQQTLSVERQDRDQPGQELHGDARRDLQEDVSMSMSLSTSMSLSMSMSMDMGTSQPSPPTVGDGGTDPDADGVLCPEDYTSLPMMPCGPPYAVGTVCNYEYQYDGCSWEELQCNWITQCECLLDSGLLAGGEGGGGGGNSPETATRPVPPQWVCIAFARIRCPEETTPLDLPRGPCDPDQPIPVRPTTTITAPGP